MIGLSPAIETLEKLQPIRLVGRVSTLRGLTVLVRDLPAPVGSLVRIHTGGGGYGGEGFSCLGEVVGFDGSSTILMTLSGTSGIRAGDTVEALHAAQTVPVGARLLGRVIDAMGTPIDGLGTLRGTRPRSIDPEPLPPLRRRRIAEHLRTGVRAIDLFTPLGRGQRVGVFAGPGVGKSTLLGCMARACDADVIVIALIGERGREVRDFIEQNLGPAGLARSVVVVATSDEPPTKRVRAALAATAIAEGFRDSGKSVLLIMDSLTRFAHAQRQIGLSIGEPPATKGYTPSVFSGLARLLERAGPVQPSGGGSDGGSITAVYSILVEGDDLTEPVSDAARGILDGHIVLSRTLAQRAHYPAIDVLDSISRVAEDVIDQAHAAARRQVMRLLAAYRKIEELVQIGAYARGSSAESDIAIDYHGAILDLLRQDLAKPETFESARSRLVKIAVESGGAMGARTNQRKA